MMMLRIIVGLALLYGTNSQVLPAKVGSVAATSITTVSPQPTETTRNLFFEEQVPFSKTSKGPPTVGRFLVSGPSRRLFDATVSQVKYDQPAPCKGKTAKIRLRCSPGHTECDKLRNVGTVVLVPCESEGRKSARIMMLGQPANGDLVELNTNFGQMNANSDTIAMSLDFSNSADYFKEAGLAGTSSTNDLMQLVSKSASKAKNSIFSDLRDKVRSWVDKVRSVNIDQSTPVSVPIGPFSKVVIDESLAVGTCTSSSSASASASIKAEVRADGNAMAIFGIKVIGTVVPFDIKEAYVYIKMNGYTQIESILNVNVEARLSRQAKALPVPFPGFGVEGLVSIGPELNLVMQATSEFKAFGQVTAAAKIDIPEHDVYVGMAGDQSETNSRTTTSFSPKLTKNVTQSIYIDGTISFDVIPSLDIGIDALAGQYRATVGIRAVGDVQFRAHAIESAGTIQACFSGTAMASIGATGVLNAKQINQLGGISWQSEPLELFRLCRNIMPLRSDGDGKTKVSAAIGAPAFLRPPPMNLGIAEAERNSTIVKRNVNAELQCLEVGFDIPASTPFVQSYQMLKSAGYELFDQCLSSTGGSPSTCSSVGSQNAAPEWRLMGYHGTSTTVAADLVAGKLRTDIEVTENDRNQYGPGLYITNDIKVAKEYATARGQPQLLNVYAQGYETMKGHTFPALRSFLETIWFGRGEWNVKKSQPYVLDYDYLVGPLTTKAHMKAEDAVVQIKFNPKANRRLKIELRDWNAPAPPPYRMIGNKSPKGQKQEPNQNINIPPRRTIAF